jgi:hypothetical protein
VLEVDMPEEARRLFAHLQRQASGTPFDKLEETIRADLGDRSSALLSCMERSPVSIASSGHEVALAQG